MPLSRWDAAEGGTTATIAILSRAPGSGTTLTVGAVGDSSALLLGRSADGRTMHELLVPEHSPTNLSEYERIQRVLAPSHGLRFVYDCPDDCLIDIFAEDADAQDVIAEPEHVAERRVWPFLSYESFWPLAPPFISYADASDARIGEPPRRAWPFISYESYQPAAAPFISYSHEAGCVAEERIGRRARTLPRARLDAEAERRADREHQCAVKNARGELTSVVIIPEGEVVSEAAGASSDADGAQPLSRPLGPPASATVEEHSIAMTRSLGDFYSHHYGVTCEPELRELRLDEHVAAKGWLACGLLLASDGVWDLWRYEEVAAQLLPSSTAAPGTPRPILSTVGSFVEATRALGDEYFGEGADNLTGVFINPLA